MNRIRHNFKVKGKNVKGWKEQAATIDPSTKIENKNEKQMRKKNKQIRKDIILRHLKRFQFIIF